MSGNVPLIQGAFMPIYEYECQDCGHRLETLQKISDAPLTDCPECGKADLQKQISAAGFRLKGGGWYSDLYSSNQGNEKTESKSDGGGESSEGDSGTKSESGAEKQGKKDKKAKKGGSKKGSPKAAA